MSISYFIGLEVAILIAVIGSGIILILMLLVAIAEKEFKDIPLILIGYIPLGIFFGFSLFIIIYPIVNILFQIHFLTVEFFIVEIKTGILFLRISSFLIGIKIMQFFFTTLFHEEFKSKQFKDFPKLKDIPKITDYTNFSLLLFSQYGYYLTILFSLWMFVIQGIDSILVLLLNWAIFFIIDDWILITDYSQIIKGRMLKKHKFRIYFFNIILFLLFIIIMCFNYQILYIIIGSVTVSMFMFLVVIFSFSYEDAENDKNSIENE